MIDTSANGAAAGWLDITGNQRARKLLKAIKYGCLGLMIISILYILLLSIMSFLTTLLLLVGIRYSQRGGGEAEKWFFNVRNPCGDNTSTEESEQAAAASASVQPHSQSQPAQRVSGFSNRPATIHSAASSQSSSSNNNNNNGSSTTTLSQRINGELPLEVNYQWYVMISMWVIFQFIMSLIQPILVATHSNDTTDDEASSNSNNNGNGNGNGNGSGGGGNNNNNNNNNSNSNNSGSSGTSSFVTGVYWTILILSPLIYGLLSYCCVKLYKEMNNLLNEALSGMGSHPGHGPSGGSNISGFGSSASASSSGGSSASAAAHEQGEGNLYPSGYDRVSQNDTHGDIEMQSNTRGGGSSSSSSSSSKPGFVPFSGKGHSLK